MENNKNTQKLIQLIKENPEARVFPVVSEDAVSGDYAYTVASFGTSNTDIYFTIDEHLESNSDCDIGEATKKLIMGALDNYKAYFGGDIDEMAELLIANSKEDMSETVAYEIINSLSWEKVIIVYVKQY